MRINKDAVVSAAALAHSVPGAELRLTRTDGGRLLVAQHSRADLSPCIFRHLVADGPCPIAEEVETWLAAIETHGNLDHVVAGVYRSRHRRGERWFVAELEPGRLKKVFDDLECDPVLADATVITMKADLGLGVVVVKLDVEMSASVASIDELALTAYASYVAEVASSKSADYMSEKMPKRKK